MKNNLKQNVNKLGAGVNIEYLIYGFFVVEFFLFGWFLGLRISNIVSAYKYYYIMLPLVILYGLLIYKYSKERGFEFDYVKIISSRRWDMFIMLIVGAFLDLAFFSYIHSFFKALILDITPWQSISLAIIPAVFFLLILYRNKCVLPRLEQNARVDRPYFIGDEEVLNKSHDLLNISSSAERFARDVLNNGSFKSMVFGIDAPWGIGKSSFVNFCIEYWDKKKKDDVIVYKFDPMRYADTEDLLDRFIDGLIAEIRKKSFVPEISGLMKKYQQFIKPKIKIPFLNFLDFEITSQNETVEDIMKKLESQLQTFDKKVIIIIDNLDRLSFSEIKHVLFTIKKSFQLPNISYILCYDTENINALEKDRMDVEKLSEFFEKFVNIKINLFIESNSLIECLNSNKEFNPTIDGELSQPVISGLLNILNSKKYCDYVPFLGDLRKIKRLLNESRLIALDKYDSMDSDLNSDDLLHLLLIYINYPNLFRKIYNEETEGRGSFFSAVLPYDNNYPKEKDGIVNDDQGIIKNSTSYSEYIKDLKSDGKIFLLNKIFSIQEMLESGRLKDARVDSIDADLKHSLACINGSGLWDLGRNLEQHLLRIVRLVRPPKESQYRFFKKLGDRVMNGDQITAVLSDDVFGYMKSEGAYIQFWKVIKNIFYDLKKEVSDKLIIFALNDIKNHSLLEIGEIGLGFRDDMSLYLVKMLDVIGWSDNKGGHRNNIPENISEITDWIFGEGSHSNTGVIIMLSNDDRGVLGLYDLLAFRLFCSADRRGDIFNLQRALSFHANEKAPTEGDLGKITRDEMREISQKVFEIFQTQYIKTNKNLFQIIDNLTLKDLVGKYDEYIRDKIASGEVTDVDNTVSSFRSRIKTFIIYQLGNSIAGTGLGVGCGFYDVEGNKDKHGIKAEMNKYLFNVCFNPEIKEANYEYFIDYLFINFKRSSPLNDIDKYTPSLSNFEEILDHEMLTDYWKRNQVKVKTYLKNKDKSIQAGNYSATYMDDLENVYKELDKLLIH